jgi:hypothetical protein
VVAVVALVSYLATVLLLLAVVLAVVAVAGASTLLLLWRLSRPSDRDQQLLAERWAAMHEGIARKAAMPAVTHYHLHVQPGTDLSGLGLEAFRRDAVTATEEEN